VNSKKQEKPERLALYILPLRDLGRGGYHGLTGVLQYLLCTR